MLGRRARVACTLCHHHFTTRRSNVLALPRILILSGQLRQQSTMFHRAVAKHQSEQPPPSKPAAPLYAPKSSSQQKDIHSAFRSSQIQRSGFGGSGGHSGALMNSRPQVSNVDPFTATKPKLPSPPTSDATNSQLFSSERDTRLLKTLSNDTAFQENSPPLEVPSVSSNIMNSLHEAVYFDEDDFDDDIDLSLDFDVDEPLIPQDLKAAAGCTPPSSNPTLPKQPPTTHVQDVPDSSAPLPWSSSPARHIQPMAAPRRPIGKVFSQEAVSQMNATSTRTISSITTSAPVKQFQRKSVPEEKPKRRLPWLHQNGGVHDDVHGEEEPEAKRPRGRKPREPRHTRGAPETPQKGPSMPWDTTASAAKAVRQEFKVKTAVQRRSISSKAEGAVLEKVVKKQKEERLHSIFLSEEQQRVIDLVLNSQNSVFFTGSAGTGKSVLLRELILKLREKHKREDGRVAVTASTGLAACNIGGVTLHSFAGIGLGKEAPADLVKKIKRNPNAKNRWLKTKVLIIDEISMVDGELFDKLESVARQIKSNGRPFGGIQLVITGDFFQLPPVPDNNRIAKFAFEADTWNTSIDHTIGLTQVFRQRDSAFAAMLNEMRLGKLSLQTIEAFRRLQRPIAYDDGIQATELFPTRSEVDSANNAKMRQLAGKVEIFEANDGGTTSTDIRMRDKLLSSCMAPQKIALKINSQVMLIKNVDETLVNGSLGRVVGFMNDRTFELLMSEGGIEDYINGVEGQADGGESLVSKRRARLKAQLVAQAVADTSRKWPLVQFIIPDGTVRQYLVQPEQWKVELPNGEVQASRTQIPLILAWALSIHKAQGQTLERVRVDLGKVFEKGQAYVALSRATCQDGLQVLRFDPKKVMAHDKVRGFYASLYSAMDASKKRAAAVASKQQVESLDLDEYDEEDEKRRLASYGSG